jgi:REP element-mobilizing transposase RayT
MARPLRLEFPGAIYHLTSRGNARLPIFEDDHDRQRFFIILQQVLKRFNWLCHAYCLMQNHYHLVVETIDGNLSQGMRHLNGVYTQDFNRRHNRTGHIFQGRYKSIVAERDSYLLELCRYVVLNPVRAGLVSQPGTYPWSSYRATAGLGKGASFVTVDWILGQFGGRRSEGQKRYRRFVLAGIRKPSLWEKVKSQPILGTEEFIEKIRPALEDGSLLMEIPKRERLVFRPSLERLLGKENGETRQERNEAILSAHLEYGYSLSEIARHLGLHYTTISKIVKEGLSS